MNFGFCVALSTMAEHLPVATEEEEQEGAKVRVELLRFMSAQKEQKDDEAYGLPQLHTQKKMLKEILDDVTNFVKDESHNWCLVKDESDLELLTELRGKPDNDFGILIDIDNQNKDNLVRSAKAAGYYVLYRDIPKKKKDKVIPEGRNE